MRKIPPTPPAQAAPLLFAAANIAALMLLVVPSPVSKSLPPACFLPLVRNTIRADGNVTAGAATVFLMARFGPGRSCRARRPAGRQYRQSVARRRHPLSGVHASTADLSIHAGQCRGRLGRPAASRTFLIGTFIGIVPSIVIYASIGDLLMELTRRGTLPDTNELREPRFFLPLPGWAALALLPIIVRHWRR